MNNLYNDDGTERKYVHNCLFGAGRLFLTEKTTYEAVSESGDYYIDYTNGIVFTYDIADGTISYEYRKFPYTLSTQPVKVFPLHDKDIDHLRKDYLIGDNTGAQARLQLNSYGAKLANDILRAYPLQWGE
jgi:hypothetical protein